MLLLSLEGAGQTLAMLSQLRSERLVTHPFCSRETSGARVINGRNWMEALSLSQLPDQVEARFIFPFFQSYTR